MNPIHLHCIDASDIEPLRMAGVKVVGDFYENHRIGLPSAPAIPPMVQNRIIPGRPTGERTS